MTLYEEQLAGLTSTRGDLTPGVMREMLTEVPGPLVAEFTVWKACGSVSPGRKSRRHLLPFEASPPLIWSIPGGL